MFYKHTVVLVAAALAWAFGSPMLAFIILFSLGDAHVELAIEAYEKALEKDPELDSALEGLKRLRTEE